MKYLLTGEESNRLKYRLVTLDDFDKWLPLFNTIESVRFLGMESLQSANARCEKWFELVQNRYDNNIGGMNALIDKDSGNLIGQCGLLVQEVDGNKELEIGYSILPEFWGNGFATEAARKCKEYAFLNQFNSSLISIIHVENSRSERVAIKNGMHFDNCTSFKDMPVNVFRILKNKLG